MYHGEERLLDAKNQFPLLDGFLGKNTVTVVNDSGS
jgi:hypothetical protein